MLFLILVTPPLVLIFTGHRAAAAGIVVIYAVLWLLRVIFDFGAMIGRLLEWHGDRADVNFNLNVTEEHNHPDPTRPRAHEDIPAVIEVKRQIARKGKKA